MKKIFRVIIGIPNFPFYLILAVYLLIRVLLNTTMVEVMMSDINDNKDLKEYIKKVYPRHLKYFIAAVAYGYLIIELIKLVMK